MKQRVPLTAALLWLTVASFGQNSFQVFFEKVYLSTDRTYYAAGEDLWFEAYLVNAQTNIRSNTSANLYVELVNPDGAIVSQETVHLSNGLGKGDFVIPAGVASGSYQLRAYTNWMKNFGTLFLFTKQLTIVSDETVKTKVPKVQPVIATVATDKATVGVNHIYFFPEGGAAVTGLQSNVAVKAVDAYGKAISTSGKIVTDIGDSIAAFRTGANGLGSFLYTPLAGKSYKAIGKYYSRELFSEVIPQPLQSGFVLSVKESDKVFTATIRADAATLAQPNSNTAYLIVRHAGKKCYSDSVKITDASGAAATILKDSLPTGLCAVSLYDAAMRPQCERLIFVDDPQPVTVSVSAAKTNYATRDSVTIEVSVSDVQGNPVAATVSLAATDANLIEVPHSNIASYLLLESEIKGEIEHPDQYFSNTNANRKAQLDLLLQTQGWRSFLWRRLKDTNVVIKYLPEPGITIAGRVRRAIFNQGVADANITLFAGKSSGDKLFFTKTRPDGRFFLDGLPLTGLQDVKVIVRNDKNKKEGMILLDSVLGRPLPVTVQPNVVYDTSVATANFWKKLVTINNGMKDQQKRAAGELENVTVRADAIKKEQLQERGMRYGRADSLFDIQPSDAQYETLARFIVQRYPGAYTDAQSDGFFFYGDRGVKILPRWIVDNREDLFSIGSPFESGPDADADPTAVQPVSSRFERVDYYNIPINKVKKVYIQPLLNRAGKLIYVVHLSLLPGAFDASDLSQIITQVNGYYEAREYFVPDFSNTANSIRTDLRPTLFWVPTLKTDANGKAFIRYRNSDAKTIVRVSVEGITDRGEPVAATMNYQVK